jgi:rifampicin phosphotransferase
MSKALVYRFPGDVQATLPEVGGKGLSLIEGTRASLPIPAGFVLTVRFFEPWFSELRQTAEWNAFLQSPDDTLAEASAALKKTALESRFSDEQRSVLVHALQIFNGSHLYAVRSSSPHEDLEGASFAGGYETVLGVTEAYLEDAIRRCFV